MQKSKFEFPRIYRSITELPFRVFRFLKAIHAEIIGKHRLVSHIVVILFLSFVFVSTIVVGFDLLKNTEQKRQLDKERREIISNINFWKDFVSKHRDYRDGYFQLAILEYRLNDLGKAKLYLEKSLAIDPNFEKGRELEQILNSKY